MSVFGGLILTNKGRNLLIKGQLGAVINYTRIAIGDGNLGGSSILDLNSLKNQVKTLPITKLKSLTGGRFVVGTTFSNNDILSGFYYRELGLFAQDPDLGEILYCYANAGALAEYINAGGGADIIEKAIDLEIIVGNASSVTATIDSSLVYATYDDLESKVDKVAGKVLSSNDYTTVEKDKLSGVAPNANNYTHPGSHAASIIAQDASNRFVTDTEKTTWNAKETPAGAQAKVDALSISVGSSLAEMVSKDIVTATNDFIVGSGVGAVAKKTLAQTKTILGIDSTTETTTGVVELATTAEVTAGADTTRVVTPKGLKDQGYFNQSNYGSVSSIGSQVLTLAYANKVLQATGSTITIPNDATYNMQDGTQITIVAWTASVVIVPSSGVTLYSKDSKRTIDGLYASATLIKIGANNWVLIGALK